ncbi:hypothetical protein OIE49_36690 [Streptomyces sp. NBC_01788]|uniref:DinB/UmuC family translesion DNA polymerase n=1 Tax=Streptomyces sp. NBC_01788 TaxID=2975940 RepID=UPI002DD9B443|nr:hypothetical protein [Streptomyces sp. NBC_01788]WSB30930.1 hypothetical protein OIE49_36690 [Streptomyces sp. NBC_01788]
MLRGIPEDKGQSGAGAAGRTATDRARGIDPRTVTPRSMPRSVSIRHRFPRGVLDGAAARAALLGLVVQLGTELRHPKQAARPLTLTFAGGTSWEKSRRMPEPSAHEDDLRQLTYRLMDAAGLQRGRLTSLALRGERTSSTATRSPNSSASTPPGVHGSPPKRRPTGFEIGSGPA